MDKISFPGEDELTWMKIEPLSDTVDIPVSAAQGDGYTFWIQAEDILGNSIKEHYYVRVDNDPPVINGDLTFARNVDRETEGYFSRHGAGHRPI